MRANVIYLNLFGEDPGFLWGYDWISRSCEDRKMGDDRWIERAQRFWIPIGESILLALFPRREQSSKISK